MNNVRPSVSSSTLSLLSASGTGDIILTVPNATSGPFRVTFTVTDNNGCLNAASGHEISSATTSIYRSGFTQALCQNSGQYDTNACYPSVNSQTQISCVQDASSCATQSTNVTWTCTFPLWYNADPTDAASFYVAQNWLASVQVTDDNASSSALTESAVGNEVDSLLAFTVNKNSISYGGLQPGFDTVTLSTTTDLTSIGNVGLDETLYGDTMCVAWTAQDSCDTGGANAGTKIPVANQKFGTSSLAYAAGVALTASTSPTSLLIHVLKTTATSTPSAKNTFWGIAIPGAITQAGAYRGQNTVTAVESSSAFW